MPLVYGELRRLASAYLRRERSNHTLQSTALVHEAFMRMVHQQDVQWKNRAHFFAIAAQMIRRILGLAHVIDLEHIKDPDLRGSCEKRALQLARELVVNADSYPRISDVSNLARTFNFT